VTIGDYFISGHWLLFYWWLLVAILMAIIKFFLLGLLVAIGYFLIRAIGGY
jgi:hypothetical protein